MTSLQEPPAEQVSLHASGHATVHASGHATRGAAGRALDAADAAWVGADASYLFLDVTPPPVDDVRRSLGALLVAGSPWARALDPATGTWTDLDEAARATCAHEQVVTGPALGGDLDLAGRLCDVPLGGRSLRVVVCPDAFLVRFSHLGGDGAAMQALLRRLMGSAEPPAPSAWSARQVERRVLSRITRRPVATVAAAVGARRGERERYVPAADVLTGVEPVMRWSQVDAAYVRRLLALRDAHWPGTPFSALLLVGVRRALAGRLAVAPRPGSELLVDLRRYLGDDAPELGNLARGVWVRSADDDDPVEVGRQVQRHLDRGTPLVDLAAALVQQRVAALAGGLVGDRPTAEVAAGGQGARVTVTYLRGLGDGVPEAFWRPGSSLRTHTAPNGPEGVTVVARHLRDAFSLDASFYPDALDPDLVQAALDDLLRDPEPLLVRPGTPGRATTRGAEPA